MRAVDLGEPCRNFQVCCPIVFRDPRDGREKVACASDVCGDGVGLAIIIDPDTGQGESHPFPGDNGAFAVLNYRDEALLFGTCSRHAYVLRLDLRTRAWAEPLEIEGQTYIFNLCLSADGLVYAGAYPGCLLLRYDPERHTLENLGRASQNPDNRYCHGLWVLPNHILISCGSAAPDFAAWSLQDAEMMFLGPLEPPGTAFGSIEVAADYVCLRSGEATSFRDPYSLAPIPRPAGYTPPEASKLTAVTLSDGRQVVLDGQDYCLRVPGLSDTPFAEIPVPRPATGILTLIATPNGELWGSSSFGQTIFRYDPATGEHWNSAAVCSHAGEVYGMAFAGDRLHLACYAGGDLVVYDPAQPWNQRGNVNPRTLGDLNGQLVRPFGRSVVGPDGAVWTGWAARYGVYGGGLSRVDPDTLEFTSWYDPVPGQSLVGVASDDRRLYFITSGYACGMPEKAVPRRLVAWEPRGAIAWQHEYPKDVRLTSLSVGHGVVVVGAGTELHLFDPQTESLTGRLELTDPCYCTVPLPDGHCAVFTGWQLLRLDPQTLSLSKLCDLPDRDLATAAVAPDGTLYFVAGSHLYRVRA